MIGRNSDWAQPQETPREPLGAFSRSWHDCSVLGLRSSAGGPGQEARPSGAAGRKAGCGSAASSFLCLLCSSPQVREKPYLPIPSPSLTPSQAPGRLPPQLDPQPGPLRRDAGSRPSTAWRCARRARRSPPHPFHPIPTMGSIRAPLRRDPGLKPSTAWRCARRARARRSARSAGRTGASWAGAWRRWHARWWVVLTCCLAHHSLSGY
jgi:hypothetical protein